MAIVAMLVGVVALNLLGEKFVTAQFEQYVESNKALMVKLHYQAKVNDLRHGVLLFESRVRGLVVTGKDEFIDNIETVFDSAYADLDVVLEETGRQPGLVDLTDSLNRMIRHKIDFNKQIINVYYHHGKQEAERLIGTGRGKKLRENILSVTQELEDSKQDEIREQEKEIGRQLEKAMLLERALPLLSTLLVSVFGFLLVRIIMRQERSFEHTQTTHEKERSAYIVRDQFISNISHEIRTPLNSVIGYCGLLQKTELNESQQKFVNAIQTSGENLLHIINELLDFGKMQEGLLVIKKSVFVLPDMVDQVTLMFQEAFRKKEVNFTVRLEEALPKELVGDAVKLRQILVNLINNALKFTNHGSVDVVVKLSERTDHGVKLFIAVTDTGIGISKEHLPRIFERFYQVNAALNRQYGGTGLGLSIIHRFVELMGGKINVTSVLGQGSQFQVELPFELEEKTVQESQSIRISMPEHKKKKILVVDDNGLNRDLTMHVLNSWNFDVDVAESGAKALSRLQRQTYDLVLMDVQMPEMDGYQTTQAIRRELKLALPIVALTAHSNQSERTKCLDAGMDDYISKPFDELELFGMITRQLAYGPPANALINLDYLRNLSKGNTIFEKRILRRFVDETPGQLTQLETAIQNEDSHAVRKVIHNLKANLAIVGLDNVLEAELEYLVNPDPEREKAAQQGSLHRIRSTLAQSMTEINQLLG